MDILCGQTLFCGWNVLYLCFVLQLVLYFPCEAINHNLIKQKKKNTNKSTSNLIGFLTAKIEPKESSVSFPPILSSSEGSLLCGNSWAGNQWMYYTISYAEDSFLGFSLAFVERTLLTMNNVYAPYTIQHQFDIHLQALRWWIIHGFRYTLSFNFLWCLVGCRRHPLFQIKHA